MVSGNSYTDLTFIVLFYYRKVLYYIADFYSVRQSFVYLNVCLYRFFDRHFFNRTFYLGVISQLSEVQNGEQTR